MKREYPYSRFSALAELRIADCLLKQNKQAEAIQAYRQFVRFRPSHSQVPYARFKIAQAHVEQIPDEWLLSPASHERDQGPTREALRQLRRFMLDFPDDERIPEAREMMTKALKLLAQHELSVAEFYADRDAYRAVVGRLQTLLDSYQGSGMEPRALLMLGRTYLDMRQRPKARRAFQELVERFPDSEQAREAREHLTELGSVEG
ncbi:MAG: outer membrane protein assembly factor BamD [Polyangiales bacterium]